MNLDNVWYGLAAAVTAVALSAIAGFLSARWLYAAQAKVRVEILQKEILRLRRRIGEKGNEKDATERQMLRMRRDIRSSLASPKLLPGKVEKKTVLLSRYDRSYGRPANEASKPQN